MAHHPEVQQSLRHLRELTARTRAELAEWDSTGWDAASTCPPWPVRRLAAHLVENAQFIHENVERGVAGLTEPGVSREDRAARVEAIAAQSPAEMAATLDRLAGDLDALFDRLTAEELERTCYHPAGNRSARWYAQQRLSEVMFHRWDLQRGASADARLDEDVAQFLLPMLLESNLPRLYARGPKGSARVAFAVQGAPDARWLLAATPDELTVQQGDAAAEATLTGPAGDLARLIYGRATLADEVAAGRIQVTGDQAAAERFLALIPAV